jgi:hypothetical protein
MFRLNSVAFEPSKGKQRMQTNERYARIATVYNAASQAVVMAAKELGAPLTKEEFSEQVSKVALEILCGEMPDVTADEIVAALEWRKSSKTKRHLNS